MPIATAAVPNVQAGLSRSAALMMGTGKGAENGILFKGGEYLEIANKVNTIVFDKTGTLTEGRPSAIDIIDLSTIGEKELLRLASIAESGSEHPLGQAIVRKAKEEGMAIIANTDSFEAISGLGLRAIYEGRTILVGTRKLMEQASMSVPENVDSTLKEFENQGKTAVLISIDGNLSGIITLADTIKENAREAIDSLKSMGKEVIMLTGDNERTANYIASRLGIERVIAQVLPQQKEKVISNLSPSMSKAIKRRWMVLLLLAARIKVFVRWKC